MASLSNINGLFDVHSTGAILFSNTHGTSGQILKSNGNAAPTWVAASTVIGGPYLPLSGGTLTGATATATGISFTVGGVLTTQGPDGGLVLRSWTGGATYGMLGTANMSGSEYSLLTDGTDTFLSGGANGSVYIRSGNNTSTHQLVISSTSAAFAGTISLPGTAAQYVTGTGALATFPSIPQGDVTSITVGNGLSGTSLSGPIPNLTMSGSYSGAFTATDLNATEIYANSGWFRNNTSGKGLYNSAVGNHFYSDGGFWNVGYSGTNGIILRNGHQGTIIGYLYGEISGEFGLLDKDGQWTFRTDGATVTELRVNNVVKQSMSTTNVTFANNVDAPSFNGLVINTTGTNNGNNQIVRTQGNGYCNFGWINSISGNHTGSITRITASDDAYLRYVTPLQFRTGVTDGYYAPTGTVSGVTSVATGNGLTGGTITGAGTISMTGSISGGFNTTSTIRNDGGHGTARLYLQYDGGANGIGALTGWTSEPGITYTSSGIGGNINVSGQYYGRAYNSGYGTYVRFNTNGDIEHWATTGVAGTSGGQGVKQWYNDSGGNSYATGSSRAPIFYDSNNTAYYGDFAGSSVFNVVTTNGNVFNGNTTVSGNNYITCGPNTSWGSSIRFGGNGHTATGTEMASVATTDGNIHLDAANAVNGIYLNYYAGTNGTFFGTGAGGYNARVHSNGNAHFPIYYDYTNTNYYGDFASYTYGAYYGRRAHAQGFQVGSYNSVGPNSDKTNPIYTIGSSYNPTDTSFSNMYGIGYSHSNMWGGGKGSGWGMYIISAGSVKATLGCEGTFASWTHGYSVAAASYRSPLFYDYNNTAYYTRPSTSSYMNSITTAGQIQCGTGGSGNLYIGNSGSTQKLRFSIASGSTSYFDMDGGDIHWRQNNGVSTRYWFYMTTANMTISGTLTQLSDLRLKENIVEIGDCISKVKAMRGIYYNRTDFNTEVTKVGVIAQEVEKVLPELVLHNEEGQKSVAYAELSAVLINAIKEQQVMIDDLKSRLEILENN